MMKHYYSTIAAAINSNYFLNGIMCLFLVFCLFEDTMVVHVPAHHKLPQLLEVNRNVDAVLPTLLPEIEPVCQFMSFLKRILLMCSWQHCS